MKNGGGGLIPKESKQLVGCCSNLVEDSHLLQCLWEMERGVCIRDIQAIELKYLMINGYRQMWVIKERESRKFF